jgi:hypothetical protein
MSQNRLPTQAVYYPRFYVQFHATLAADPILQQTRLLAVASSLFTSHHEGVMKGY